MIRVITAPDLVEPENDELVLFLAGPITGAPDWQSDAIAMLKDRLAAPPLSKSLIIANPRRPFAPDTFEEQVAWEVKWLNFARNYGCILFWCAREAEPHPERSYAQTTRFELGEAFSEVIVYKNSPPGLTIGVEPGFPGEKYIRWRCSHRMRHGVRCPLEVYSTLEASCDAAVEALRPLR